MASLYPLTDSGRFSLKQADPCAQQKLEIMHNHAQFPPIRKSA